MKAEISSEVTSSNSASSQAAVGIEITNASLQYLQATSPTLHNLSLTIAAKQWTCLLGKSGSGKTTLLRYLAGLLNNQVSWQGQLTVSDGKPLAGRIAYMAQQDLLLPWLTVEQNVCLSQRLSGQRITQEIKTKALMLLEQVGLSEYNQTLPQKLSGGMRQRVALARTLMQDKPVVLMDEPFSALDAVTRHKLQTLAFELLKAKTVMLITHDPQEAIRLADTLYILHNSDSNNPENNPTNSPPQAQSIALPMDATPRGYTAESAIVQQQIFQVLAHLERQHD